MARRRHSRRSAEGEKIAKQPVDLQDLSAALVAEIEGALAFGNVRRISSLASALRIILPLASKLPAAKLAGGVCPLCQSPERITEFDVRLIEAFVARQKQQEQDDAGTGAALVE